MVLMGTQESSLFLNFYTKVSTQLYADETRKSY